MSEPIPRRAKIAFVVAPLASIGVLAVVGAALLIAQGYPIRQALGSAVFASQFFALFGLPVAYLITLGLGWPAYDLLREAGRLRARPILVIGTLAGGLTMPVVWHVFFGGPLAWETALLGAAMGAAVGGVFAWVGLERAGSRPGHLTTR